MNKFEELKDWQIKNGFTKPKSKLKIHFDSAVYAQIIRLVQAHPIEIGWDMVITKEENGYKVWDILVYPQKVSAAYVSVDLGRYGLWRAYLDTKTEAALCGQAHSHVNMSTYPSIVDEDMQYGEIMNRKQGFFLFQIWNKRNEVNSFFYDIDNHIYYTDNDIDIIVDDVDDLVKDSFNMVSTENNFMMEAGEGFESEQVI